jgi:hypothetical protein
MSATKGSFWFWSDWLGDPEVRRLSPAERGFWIDCLAIAATALPYGYVVDNKGRPLSVAEHARISNCSEAEAAQLIAGVLEKGAASRDRAGRLFNRRMVRDASISAKRSLAGKKGAARTNLIHQSISRLPRQMPQQKAQPPPRTTPQQSQKERSDAADSAARARETLSHSTAGSLATAPDGGALTRPPGTEQAANGKPASEWTRSDFEAHFRQRRKKNH